MLSIFRRRSSEKRRLHIGLNLLYLIPGEVGGVETYARSLIEAILREDQDNLYTVFIAQSAANLPFPEVPNLRKVVIPVSNRRRIVRYAWEQLLLPIQVWLEGIDLLHSLNYVGPLWTPCKSIVTVHDANAYAVGNDMPWMRRFGLRTFSTLVSNWSDRVVTVSEFSKRQISRYFSVKDDKIQVIHSGTGFQNVAESSVAGGTGDASEVLKRYGIRPPYIAAFGGGYAHKNIPFLLSAFCEICEKFDLQLVLIGRLAPGVSIADHCFPAVQARIKVLGHIPATDIPVLLSRCSVFAFPSLYEGFGFPVLEAQCAGVPVVCSNAACIPEVAGLGAEYFQPTDLASAVAALQLVLSSTRRQAQLRTLAAENVKRFSWGTTASRYIELYQQCSARVVS